MAFVDCLDHFERGGAVRDDRGLSPTEPSAQFPVAHVVIHHPIPHFDEVIEPERSMSRKSVHALGALDRSFHCIDNVHHSPLLPAGGRAGLRLVIGAAGVVGHLLDDRPGEIETAIAAIVEDADQRVRELDLGHLAMRQVVVH